MRFTDQLPPGQSMRLRGELLMEDPDTYLRQICNWLGIDDGTDAIEAMKHPENSPFACMGPPRARFGNNADYLLQPALRIGKPSQVSLKDPLPWLQDVGYFSDATIELAQRLGYQ